MTNSIEKLSDRIHSDYKDAMEYLDDDLNALMEYVENARTDFKEVTVALDEANEKLRHLEAQVVKGLYNTLVPEKVMQEHEEQALADRYNAESSRLTTENEELKMTVDWMGKRITKLEGDAAEQRLSAMRRAH